MFQNLEGLDFLWSILALPIGMVIKWVRSTNSRLVELEKSSKVFVASEDIHKMIHTDIKPIRDEVVAMRNDFKEVNTTMSKTASSMDTKLSHLMISLIGDRGSK